jgi:hypothetical protein
MKTDKDRLPILDNTDIVNTENESARKILGETAKDMSDDELKDQIVMAKYLVESWLDEYEKSIFEGKTLKEKLE